MKRKIVALVQARTDSTRLPGKVLKLILSKPMIIWQLERTCKSELIDNLILVTSNERSDDELVKIAQSYGFKVFRGDKNNVLKRFYDVATTMSLSDSDIIVRLTGDCPLHDAKIIDESIRLFIDECCDYFANCVKPVYPDGFDVEVFTYKALKLAYFNANKKSQLEHVTPYIRDSGDFVVRNLEKCEYCSDIRLTVDEERDFIVIKKIYEHFKNDNFSLDDIISFLMKHPEISNLNNTISRNEGYLKSLKEDDDN